MPYCTSDTYIVDGNITIFLGPHTQTFKQDILYSSLLGHLLSNSHSITSDAWLNAYKKTLGTFFWVTQNATHQLLKKQSASILKFAKPTLSTGLSVNELNQLTLCLAMIKNLPKNSDALTALLSRVQLRNDSHASVTTVCPLLTIVSANKTVTSFRPLFDTSHSVDMTVLDEELSQREILNGPQITQWTTYLAEEKYASVRNKIIEKLGSKISTNLYHLTPAEEANISDV